MSDLRINFKIITPEKTVFESEVSQATLPVSEGEVTILANHRPYIASLDAGEIVLKSKKADGEEEINLVVSGGFIEFNENSLVVLADTAERAEEIDLKRAEEARARAEELKKNRIDMDETDYARVAAAIQKESARIRVAKKHYTRNGMKIN
jgi:F-type H+-transporting ATPase subunit epsilon